MVNPKPITKEEFKILSTISQNPLEFAKLIYVIHPVRGKVKFNLYPFQKIVIWHFLTRRFNILLKFRQAGITECIALFCLWLAQYHPNKNVQIISIKDTVAKKVLRKIKFMYKNLPAFAQVPITNGKSESSYGTAREMEFANGSIISSIPTTEEAGRSEAMSLLVVDEAAIVRWANQIWAAAFPTLSTGGNAIVNSTPYGIGNWFHAEWVKACSSANGPTDFNPIRLTWDMHPERDIEWYSSMSKTLGPRRTAQEIDGDFLSSGNTVFDLVDIRAIDEIIEETEILEQSLNGNFRVIHYPTANGKYYIGADVSTGRATDFSGFSVVDRYGKEMAYFKGKISPDKYANLLMQVGYRFNNAVLAPEGNDIGLAVIVLIQQAGYPNLYYTVRLIKEKGKSKPKEEKIPGWYTTTANRPVIIDQLEQDIRNGELEVCNPFFTSEAYTFIYDGANRPVAMGKSSRSNISMGEAVDEENTFSDDSIMGLAIANYVRKSKINVVVPPR